MHLRKFVPNLKDDESVYVFARPYFLSFLPWITLGIAMLIVGVIMVIIAATTFPEIQQNALANNIFIIMSSAFFLLILPFLTVAFIDFYYDVHIVTDRRLIDIDQHALFKREINELALEEVQDVTSIHQGVLGNIFDYGLVSIETASSNQKFEFQYIRHPNEIAAIILDLADQAKMRIERGPGDIVSPRSEIKAVINDKIYSNLRELETMGAVVPIEVGSRVGKDMEGHIPSSGADPKRIHTVELAGVVQEQEVKAKPVHHPPEQVEVIGIDPKRIEDQKAEVAEDYPSLEDEKETWEESQEDTIQESEPEELPASPPPAVAPPKKAPAPADPDELDIIIDDPNASKK
ncbi:MAG TPA: PH domain-containing protein [Patescibacteria group bacterium]